MNTKQRKCAGSVTQHLNENIRDGDEIIPCEAKSKVGTHRHAGKLGGNVDFSARILQLILFCLMAPFHSLFLKQHLLS
jgi:hypothetical protein